VDEQTVRALAEAAGLALAEGREAALAAPLAGWLAGENELSDLMAAPEHDAVEPITFPTWRPRASST
jgi:hypothetical protein